jgi:2-hydroxychromene-2-carboxylate isomerase
MKTARWYFDYISPYAYLQSAVLARFDGLARIEPKPVLFAGLLNHFGQKGPAEIPAKKVQTFREVVWLAHVHRIPLNLPHAHPFNPLPLLRLSIALGNDADVMRALFRHVWVDGHLPTDPAPWTALCRSLGVDDPDAALARADVKAALRRNTEEAIALGVFGVPTLAVDDQLFWGFDMTDAALAYLRGDALFRSPAMLRAQALPDGVHRAAAR